ncbi:conjugal transfer protein TraK [Flagellimonas onchidii]|uniref:conjugal transfer protein TraK n=1 Tax=Flagellimonas onchidii TaxID=2562684 RepID=UPI0010A6660F|nr:conjugal transfer protein TraK [Allomuricauda onchidii]
MKTPYKNIYEVLRLNRFIVLTIVIACSLSTVISSLVSVKMFNKAVNGAFAIGRNGEVMPLKWMEQIEGLQVEALNHLDLFHSYFYGIDATNFENNIEKSLWLGDESVDNVYRQKKADGVYNRLVQYSLVQKVIDIDSQIDLTAEPYPFKTVTVFQINRGSIIDTYELVTTGKLIHLEKRNFPKNTNALLITDYFENSLKKIDYEN